MDFIVIILHQIIFQINLKIYFAFFGFNYS